MKPYPLLFISLTTITPVFAQDTDALRGCTDIADNGARLACYDRAMDVSKPLPQLETPRVTVVQEPALTVSPPTQVPENPVIVSEPTKAPENPVLVSEPTEAPESPVIVSEPANAPANPVIVSAPNKAVIEAPGPPAIAEADAFGLELKNDGNTDAENSRLFTVATARHNKFTGWTIEFTNGQTWKQVGTDPYKIEPGSSYIITRATLNSFMLNAEGKRSKIRITRAQ